MTRRSLKPGHRRGITRWATSVFLGPSLLLAGALSVNAQQIQLTIAGGAGAPGGTANVTLQLSGDTGAAVGAGLDILFPLTENSLTVTPAQDCAIAPRLQGTHILSARLLPTAPGGQLLGLDVATNPPNINLLGNGDLVTCAFHIPQGASLGVVGLTVAPGSVLVSDANAQILPATGVNGEVTIALVSPTPTTTPVLTPTATPPIPSPSNTPTTTPPNTPTNTVTVPPTPTQAHTPPPNTATVVPTRTNTVPIGPTVTQTPRRAGGGGGCSIAMARSADSRAIAWLGVPAALFAWRRRKQR